MSHGDALTELQRGNAKTITGNTSKAYKELFDVSPDHAQTAKTLQRYGTTIPDPGPAPAAPTPPTRQISGELLAHERAVKAHEAAMQQRNHTETLRQTVQDKKLGTGTLKPGQLNKDIHAVRKTGFKPTGLQTGGRRAASGIAGLLATYMTRLGLNHMPWNQAAAQQQYQQDLATQGKQ